MGIRKWKDHKGRRRIYLSRTWPDGTRYRRVMPNMTVAKNTEARIAESIAMGTWRELREELSGRENNPTVEQFSEVYLEACRQRNRRPKTKEYVLKPVVRILGKRRIRDLSRSDVKRFSRRRRQEVSAATVNRGIAVLRHMLSYAVEEEIIDRNCLLSYKMHPEPPQTLRILTFGQYRKLVVGAAKEDHVMGAYVAVLGETGLRKNEGLTLEWGQVDLSRRKVAVGRSKSGRSRYVPLTEFATQWLQSLVRMVGVPQVFVNLETGNPWKDPRGPFKAACKAAGLEWVKGFHDLRHFRATQWLRHGVDVRTVQELLGHSAIATTMRYVHYVQDHAERSVREAEKRELSGRKVDGEISQSRGCSGESP